MKNKAMLEGKELGRALSIAMDIKGVGPTELAAVFGVKPPSVSDWKARGCISKRHLPGVIQFFSDVVTPEHWGMGAGIYGLMGTAQAHEVREPTTPWPASTDKIKQALDTIGVELSRLSMTRRERLAPLFESFARSPGDIIKRDIATLLDSSDDTKSPEAAQA